MKRCILVPRNSARLVVLAGVLSLFAACEKSKTSETTEVHQPVDAPQKRTAAAPQAPSQDHMALSEVKESLFDIFDRCTLGQRGLVLDIGSLAAESRRLHRLVADTPPTYSLHLGEQFRNLQEMRTSYVFWLTDDLTDFEFSARVHSEESERIAIYIDGKRLGAGKLKKDQTRVVKISGKDRSLQRGRHQLTLSLSRPRRGRPSADISWARLGRKRKSSADFPATRAQIDTEVTIEDERHRAFVLAPSSSIRCPIFLPPGAQFKAQLGIWGDGLAELEVIVHTSDGSRVIVAHERRDKKDSRAFKEVTADLSSFGSQLVDIELLAPHGKSGARLAVANPLLLSHSPLGSPTPSAARAIVVILAGLSQEHSPPQAGKNGLPFFNQFAREATSYPNYRTSSTSATAFIATLLTGLAPWQHQLETVDKVLASSLAPLASAVEGQGGKTSFFTEVPTSFEPFGFNRGFELFAQFPPQAHHEPLTPLTEAKKWLEPRLHQPGALLSLIYLRGAHPPFDISREDARELPPAEYSGDLSPRRAAVQLQQIRQRRRTRRRRMPQEDWQRLHALKKAALLKQDAALGKLIAWLHENDAYEETLIVVMGDLAAGEKPLVPYAADAPLTESYLSPPLFIKFPKGHLRGRHQKGLFAPRDITTTLLATLGITRTLSTDGIDLGASNASRLALVRPHIAYRNHAYSLRLGTQLLRGTDGKTPRLCNITIDPNCSVDRSEQNIMEARALWLAAWSQLSPSLTKQTKNLALEENSEIESSLVVWGNAP